MTKKIAVHFRNETVRIPLLSMFAKYSFIGFQFV